MAQIVSVRLSRPDNSPWGFRLQGGKDFGQPLLIQKVNGGSLAERGGLQVGDALIRVNNVEVADMRHKEAQDTIVRAGHNLEISLQRGSGSTWRPQVSPVGQVPSPASPGYASPLPAVTKTSLSAKPTPAVNIGSGHNLSPKPFGGTPQVNGDSVKAIVNKQYNTPVGMYSEETIAETLSAQAEVLAGGAIGVNFMKNEKTYDSQKSEVFKMVQEVDKEPRSPEPSYPEPGTPVLPPVVSPGSGLRHVQPPEPRPVSVGSPQPQQLPPGQNICADCERLIVGVFVRIKDKNLHVDCFKCATCGTSLKNVGYYSINNKLYCDIHAKLVARQNPPVPNFEPVTVPPGGRVPPGAFITSQLPAAAPHSPQPGTLAPLPFHAPRTTTSHVSPRIGPQTGSSVGSGPKPFGSSIVSTGPTSVPWSSPQSTPAAPFGSPPLSNIGISKPHPEPHTTVVWPPPSHVQTTTDISISQLEDKRLSICSEEVSRIASRRVQEVSYTLDDGRPSSPVPDRHQSTESSDSLKNVKSDREKKEIVEKTVLAVSERLRQTHNLSPKPPKSPRSQSPRPVSPIPGRLTPRPRDTPELLDIRSKPHGLQSLLPPACVMRPLSPQHIVVFPPQIPDIIYPRSPTPKPRRKSKSPERCRTCPSPLNALVEYQPVLFKSEETNINKQETEDKMEKMENSSPIKKKEVKMEDVCLRESKTVKKSEVLYTKEQVQRMIHKEVIKALSIKNEREAEQDLAEQPVSLAGLPEPTAPGGTMAFALSTASEKPFTPIPFPKPMEIPSLAPIIGVMETVKTKEEKPVSLPKETLPYFPPAPPPPEKEGRDDRTARALREVGVRSPLTEGFTIAPDRPYSPLPTFTTVTQAETVLKPVPSQRKPISLTSTLTVAPSEVFTVPGKKAVPSGPIVSVEEVQKPSAFKPVPPRGNNCASPEKVTKQGVNLSQIAEGGRMKEAVKSFESLKYQKTAEASEKKTFPYYQENVSPIPQPSRVPVANPTPVYIPQPSVKTEVSQEISVKSEQKKEQLEMLVAKGTSQRPVTPSGLHPPDHLPYYQKNIGEIPVRNKSISPIPHPIRAPPLDPCIPQNKTYSTGRSNSPVPQYKSTTYSETKTYSAKVSSSKAATNISKKTEMYEPELEKLSPQSWKAGNVRTVQNLSPITVRLPSPKPLPLAPRGEQDQAAIADVHIHKPRSTSPLPPTVKVDVKYPPSPSTVGHGKSSARSGESTEHVKGKHQTKLGQPHQNIPKICVESDSCGSDQQGHCNKTCALKVSSESEKKSTGGKMMSVQTREENIIEKVESTKNVQTRQETKSIMGETSSGRTYSASQKPSEGTSGGQGKVNGSHSNEKYCNQAFSYAKTDGHSSSGQNVSRESSDKRQTMSTKFNSKKIDEHWGKTSAYDQLNELQKVGGKSVNISEISGSSTAFHVQRGFGQPKGTFQVGQDRSSIASSTKHGQNGPVTIPLPTIPSFPQTSDLCGTAAGGGGGGGVGTGRGTLAGSSAPKRGRGILNPSVAPGGRIPLCGHCNAYIRGPFITALGKIWCPEHFICVNAKCGRALQDIGFVEESDGLYCEFCFERYLAPTCDKCAAKIKGDCLNAIGKHFHPECFCCAYCGKLFGNNPFFLEDALPYCENDWNELFTTKCFSCGFPIEAGDRWVEALSNNYHSQCFNCTMCKKNLEGQSFFAKGGRPFCKNHAR